MACSRGAASPNAHTERKLFAASGGYCQNPDCSRELFIDYPEKRIHVAEMAHVFAANDDGPRANRELSKEGEVHLRTLSCFVPFAIRLSTRRRRCTLTALF
jgi:hypothetical protein